MKSVAIVMASQLGVRCDSIIRAELKGAIEVRALGRGPVVDLPPDVTALFALPFGRAGLAPAPRPAGWPFGLKWVQLASAGLDAYPDWLFDGPVVTSARGTLATPIAEYCLAAIFAAAKEFPGLWIDSPDRWRMTPLQSVEGSTLGIYGFGAIGQALATRAQALGMDVIVARKSSAELPAGLRRAAGIGQLLAESHHLVLAAPATGETRHIVNAASLMHARPDLHLINVSRGALVDSHALIDALDSGRIGLATLDVAETEPLPAGHPLYLHPKVRLSPHTSAVTRDMDARLARLFIDNFRRFLAGAELLNVASGEG